MLTLVQVEVAWEEMDMVGEVMDMVGEIMDIVVEEVAKPKLSGSFSQKGAKRGFFTSYFLRCGDKLNGLGLS